MCFIAVLMTLWGGGAEGVTEGGERPGEGRGEVEEERRLAQVHSTLGASGGRGPRTLKVHRLSECLLTMQCVHMCVCVSLINLINFLLIFNAILVAYLHFAYMYVCSISSNRIK